jgi:hypothetical protein
MSYHGTHVVVIEIPEGTPRPTGDSLNLQTANLSARRYTVPCSIPQTEFAQPVPGDCRAPCSYRACQSKIRPLALSGINAIPFDPSVLRCSCLISQPPPRDLTSQGCLCFGLML